MVRVPPGVTAASSPPKIGPLAAGSASSRENRT